jgi:dihydroflavonol-4-reductase
MKTLVTGANGFMGSAVVRELLKDGTEVRALVRQGSDARNLDGLDVETVRGDLCDADSIRRAVEGCRQVFHVAAMVAFWVPPVDRDRFTAVNVVGTKNVLNAARDLGVEKVVYTSTISTIGSFGKQTPTNEEHYFNMWNMSMEYEKSKYSAEFEAWRYAARGLPVVAVLPAAPVGPRDIKPNPVGKLILDFLHRKIPGIIEGGGNFIDVDDIAYGHVLAAKRGKTGERYILGDQNLSVVELFGAIEAISGVKAPRMKVPYAGALALSHFLTFMADHVTGRHPLVTPPLVKMSSQYYYVETSKAREELGFVPRSNPIVALLKAIRWFLDNDYVKLSEPRKDAIRRRLEAQPEWAQVT